MIEERGPSSETCGLLGRIHKDRWEKARRDGRAAEARGHLRKAIAAYRQGFETDWRDAYPGVNAATLMTIADPRDRAAKEIAGVARYAVRQRQSQGADYWDHATLVELAAIEGDWDGAEEALGDALAALDEGWKAASSANNLRLIVEAREAAGLETGRLTAIVNELAHASNSA